MSAGAGDEEPADAVVLPVDPAILGAFPEGAEPAQPTLEEQRRAYGEIAIAMGGEPVAVERVSDLSIPRPGGGSVPARAYHPHGAAAGALPALVWFHGGGWVLGDLDGFDRVARRLADAGGCVCVSVDYRLAPEHPFPAAVEDADAVVAWLTGAGAAGVGVDPARVSVGGDSAGGQLAAVAALHARDRVRGQFLVYPALDPAADSESYTQFADGPGLTAAAMGAFWDAYRAGLPIDTPDLDVTRADLDAAPAAYLAIAGHDPLRDDGRRYARLLRDAGVQTEVRTYLSMTHGFLRWGALVDDAQDVIAWFGSAAAG